ncbi:MAG: hypothetical protein J2P36_04970, partial [Ktedonobacteraceae bacterium]|nr:hypothetical protein [Ktedonobacteraceae bacterium]
CEGLTLTMDSGAFTKCLTRADLERYAQLIIELQDRFLWYANGDKVGDQGQSTLNYAFLLSLLPSNLHEKVLWVHQVNAPLAELDRALKCHKRLGVGGLVPLFAQDPRAGEQQLLALASRVAAAGVEAHYFGIVRPGLIRRLQEIHGGNFSCDSSTWLVGAKFRRLIREDGRQVPMKGFRLTPKEMLAQNVRVMLSWLELEPVKVEPGLQLSLF